MYSRSNIRQSVQTNLGTVIGEYHAATGANAPPVDSIIEYLRHIAQTYDNEYSRAEKRFWRGPFFACSTTQHTYHRVDLLDLVDELFATNEGELTRPAIVLLSEPGVGNTSALLYVADRIAETTLSKVEQLQGEHEEKRNWIPAGSLIPLYIRLAELHPSQFFLTLVQAAFNREAPKPITLDETHMLLKEYDCLLLLDELEMVTNLGNAEGLQLTRQFIDLYASERFIFSCRESSYSYQLGQLETYKIDKLTKREVDKLLQEVEEDFDDLDKVALRTFGRNRSMLEIYLERKKKGSDSVLEMQLGAKSRAAMQHEMIRSVLAAADRDMASDELLEDILEQVGYRMHVDRTLRYSETQLIELIRRHLDAWGERRTTVRKILRAFQHTGIMKREDQRLWRFHIRPTQAYFAAAAMAHDPEKTQVMLAEVSAPWWRETLEVFMGLTADPNDLIFSIIDRDPMTAANCIRNSSQPINQLTINAIIDALLEQLKYTPSEVRAEIIRVMGRECRPPAGVLWYLLYRETDSNVILATARTLAHHGYHSKIDKRRYQVDVKDESDVPDVMQEVIRLWRECNTIELEDEKQFAAEEKFLEILDQPARSKKAQLIKGVAAMALGAIGTKRGQEQLVQQLMVERSDFASWLIVDALTQIRRQDLRSDVMRLYKRGKRQQLFAVYLLGWVGHWRGQTDNSCTARSTIEILEKSLNHEIAKMRGYAAQSLGMLGLAGSATLLEESLKLKNELDPWVLRKVIKALGKAGSLNSLPVLELNLWDESAVIRRRTREAIAEIERRFELV